MKFIKIFLKRPVFTSMLFLGLSVLGLLSLLNISYDLLPEVRKPELTIHTEYPGASPDLVENEITRRVEEGVFGTEGVEDVRSISTEGRSIVTVYFHRKSELKEIHLKLRERMDRVYWQFPEGAERPIILEEGPTTRPIMGIWVRRRNRLIRKVVTRRLEQVEGVSEARILGTRKNEIRIQVEPALLESYGLKTSEIRNVLKSYNIELHAGMVREGNYSFPLRFESGTKTPEEVGKIPLGTGRYKLKDVAKIEEVQEKRESAVLFNGEEGYFIQIFKTWGTNAVKVSQRVRELTGELKANYPELEFRIPFDDAKFITHSIKNILIALILGGILAFLALFIFTGNRKVPFILSISMPLSIIPAFFLFYLAGISINTMSLAGIALGIGMLVDSSIVVLESIIKRGDALKGAGEVGLAVTTGILTTIAVFFPIIYLRGLSGMLLKPLAFAVITTLLFSLLVAFSILPLLSKKITTTGKSSINKKLENLYTTFQRKIYGRPVNLAGGALLFLLIGFSCFFVLPKEIVPPIQKELIVEYELPFNTEVSHTEAVGERISEYFTGRGADVVLLAGETDPFGLSHTGEGKLRIKGYSGNPDLKKLFSSYRNISFRKEEYNPVLSLFKFMGKITIRGYYNTVSEGESILAKFSEKLGKATIPYSKEIPVVKIELREQVIARTDLTPEQIIARIRMIAGGDKILDIERGEEKLSLKLESPGNLENLKIDGIPLTTLADIDRTTTRRAFIRWNGKRCIEAILPYSGRINLPDFRFPMSTGGELKEFQSALRSAGMAFSIAVFLVFLILASFYESFKIPFLIMIVVPFAVTGFLISLLLTGTSLNLISMIGLIVLVGIVVNDSIVLIDRAEHLKIEGVRSSGKLAGRERLRPIVLTTITTVFGLIPFSLGSTLHAPMGRGIIGGLLLSTFGTLILLPYIYDRLFSK